MGTHREHKKKHHSHRHSEHSSSKRHHKSKSKHHHRKHHHHHHKKSHHGKHETIELQLDDKVLQNALDCLEAGALTAIRDSNELTPEALNSLVSSTITNARKEQDGIGGDSNDSDSTSDSSSDGDDKKAAMTGKKDPVSGDSGRGTLHRHCEGDKEVGVKVGGVGEKEVGNVIRDEQGTASVVEGKQTSVSESAKVNVGVAKIKVVSAVVRVVRSVEGNGKKVEGGSGKGETDGAKVRAEAGSVVVESSNAKVVAGGTKVKTSDPAGDAKVRISDPKVLAGGAKVKINDPKVMACDAKVDIGGAKVVMKVRANDAKVEAGLGAKVKTGAGARPQTLYQPQALPKFEAGAGAEVKADSTVTVHVIKGSPKAAVEKDVGGSRIEAPKGGRLSVKDSKYQSSKGTNTGRVGVVKGEAMAMIKAISSEEDSDSDDDDDLPIHPKKISTRKAIKIRISQHLQDQALGSSSAPSQSVSKQSNKPSIVRSEASKVTYVNLKSGSVAGKKNSGVSDLGLTKAKSTEKKPSSDETVKVRSNRRSKSRSESPSRKKRHSKSRHRSRSRSRRKSRSRSKRKSHSRSRRRSRSRSRRRSRSRSRRRSHSKSRHGYHSGSLRRRSVSHDSSRHRRSRRKRSRSRSRNRRHSRRSKRSRTASTSRSRSRSRRSYSRSRSPAVNAKPSEVVESIPTIAKGLSKSMKVRSKKKSISNLTDFCKKLQKKQKVEDMGGPVETADQPPIEYRAPYVVGAVTAYQTGLVYHNNAWKTPNQIVAETNSMLSLPAPLTDQFPVSTGLQHKTSTQVQVQGGVVTGLQPSVFPGQQSVDITDIAIKRVLATERLKVNPGDLEAINILVDVEQKTQVWAQSKAVPGQFTGGEPPKLKPLDHRAGFQAWAKKNMFRDLAPVMSGFGMKMLTKMGWEQGKPLGKLGTGLIIPIAVEVKVGRSGLTTLADSLKAAKPAPTPFPDSTILVAPTLHAADKRSAHLVEGKHPVSALQEICNKKRWGNPDYKMVECEGPAHKKIFLYEVTIPLGTFRSANASKNKKNARMEAATAALQGLGLVQRPQPPTAVTTQVSTSSTPSTPAIPSSATPAITSSAVPTPATPS